MGDGAYAFRRSSTQDDRSQYLILPTPPPSTNPGLKTRRVLIDNRDRIAASKSAFDFIVDFSDFDDTYRNVSSVTLLGASIPKVANEDYCLVDIEEMNHNQLETSSGNYSMPGSDVIFFDSSLLTAGQVKPIEGHRFCPKKYAFDPPLTHLRSLHVRILKHAGTKGAPPTVISAADTGGVDRLSLLFEIQCQGTRA